MDSPKSGAVKAHVSQGKRYPRINVALSKMSLARLRWPGGDTFALERVRILLHRFLNQSRLCVLDNRLKLLLLWTYCNRGELGLILTFFEAALTLPKAGHLSILDSN